MAIADDLIDFMILGGSALQINFRTYTSLRLQNSLPEYLGRCHMDEVVAEEEVRPHYRCSCGMAQSEGVCSLYRSAMIW